MVAQSCLSPGQSRRRSRLARGRPRRLWTSRARAPGPLAGRPSVARASHLPSTRPFGCAVRVPGRDDRTASNPISPNTSSGKVADGAFPSGDPGRPERGRDPDRDRENRPQPRAVCSENHPTTLLLSYDDSRRPVSGCTGTTGESSGRTAESLRSAGRRGSRVGRVAETSSRTEVLLLGRNRWGCEAHVSARRPAPGRTPKIAAPASRRGAEPVCGKRLGRAPGGGWRS